MDRTVIPLDSALGQRPAARTACGSGSASASGCGTPPRPAAIPAAIQARIHDHPCYSEDAHHHFARMHVAVAPACNIQCHYCNRKYDCANESRPGVVSERLSPDDAARKVAAVAAAMPELSVVGVAGPGDALADHRHTFATFRRLRQTHPDLKLCLSTNGLALPDHVAEIKALGVDHVTITMNAVDARVGAGIYAWVFWNHRRLTGLEAAEALLARQLEGLDALVRADILVKINSVLIPGVNDSHLADVNAEVRRRGAFLHNVMPLISDPRHGTHYGLTGQRGPTPDELQRVQDGLGQDARLMRHCRQCRADAVGLLGEDRSASFTLAKLPAPPPVAAPDVAPDVAPAREQVGEQAGEQAPGAAAERQAYRQVIAGEQADMTGQAALAAAAVRALGLADPTLIAVCSKGGGRINQHFGHAEEFKIFAADADGIRFVGHRRIERYCQGGDGDDDSLEATIAALAGVGTVLCARIGRCPEDRLKAAGIVARQDFAFEYIETAIARCVAAAEDRASLRAGGRCA